MKVKSLKKPLLMQVLIIMAFCIIPLSSYADNDNMVANPGFESGLSGSADNWSCDAWDKAEGASQFVIDDRISRTGKRSALITNNSPNDARYRQEITVKGNKYYRLSCYIRTENVGIGDKGANISVEGIIETSDYIKGTNPEWKRVELYGKTKKGQTSLTVSLGLGGYGSLNTGKAWFDDVLVEEADKAPANTAVANLYRDDAANPGSQNNSSPQDNSQAAESANTYNSAMLVYMGLFLLASCLVYYAVKKKLIKLRPGKEKLYIFIILAAALVLRIIFAPVIEGWPNDISANKYWASAAARDIFGFYNNGWCDYPPFAIYIFYVIGKIAALPEMAAAFTLLIKLPSIVADIVTAYLLYNLGRKHFRVEFGLAAAVLYAFHPAIFLDSTIWGQVDSFFTMIIIGALILMLDGRIGLSAMLFAIAVLFKPQGIFFLPVLLFELIKRRNWKDFMKCALCGLAAAILIILPFSFKQEPLWIFKLYLDTASEYKAALMNAFNIFGLFGANFKDASATFFIFSYNTWGLIFDILILGFSGFLYLKCKNTAAPVLCALILNTGAFIFSTKMHERYMFPAIAIALMAVILLKGRRLAVIFAVISTTVFFNIHLLFYRMLLYGLPAAHMPANYPALIIFSLVNVIMFIYLAKVSYDIAVRGKALLNL